MGVFLSVKGGIWRGRAALLAILLSCCGVFALVQSAAASPRSYERGERGGELAELGQAMRDPDAAKRRRAVRDLAALGGRDAWELVVEALADPKGEVADEAQFQLALLDEERVLRDLLGKRGLRSKDPWVRQRVAEAFGRMSAEIEWKDLVEKVSRRDPALSEMLLWSIERRVSVANLGGDLDKCARTLAKLVGQGGEARVRAQALSALALLRPEMVDKLVAKLIKEREPVLRCALLDVLRTSESEALWETALRLKADPDPSVRLAVLRALRELGTRAAVALVIERLEVEPRLRLQVACLATLQSLSGLKHRADPRPWRRWLASLAEDWVASPGGTPTTEFGRTASFAGLPILSDRVVFLIDFSGSLWYEREGRPARKGRVDELMREALPRLTEEAEFNVIPYTGEPHPWRPALVRATERNVKIALADFEANTVRGSGNVFDAVLLALGDPRVDRLVILTDGAPTGGRRWKLELMVPLLEQAARFRGVAIDSVVVDAAPRLRRPWADLAARTGGRSLAVDL